MSHLVLWKCLFDSTGEALLTCSTKVKKLVVQKIVKEKGLK